MKRDRRTAAAGAAILLLTTAWVAPARACPMCKDGTAVDAAAQPDTAGLDFNASVYAMLGVVAVVGGAAGRAMVKAVRG